MSALCLCAPPDQLRIYVRAAGPIPAAVLLEAAIGFSQVQIVPDPHQGCPSLALLVPSGLTYVAPSTFYSAQQRLFKYFFEIQHRD